MAPILEALGPLLVAVFVPQQLSEEQQQASTSKLSLRHLILGNSHFNGAQKFMHSLFCSPSTTPHNHLSFAGDAAAQLLFTSAGHGFRSGCFHSTFATALTPHRTASGSASNTALLATGRGMGHLSGSSKAYFSTSSVLSLYINGGGGNSDYFSGNSIAAVSSLLGGIQKNANAFVFMVLLALQFGLQPILTKKFTPKTVNRSTIVLTQEMVKFIASACILLFTGAWSDTFSGWDVKSSIMISGLPAALYSIQNIVTLIAYQNLDPLTFNVLNQTKTLSAALCVYLLMGKVQSHLQIVSLGLLFLASCVIEKIIHLDELFRWWTRKSSRGDQGFQKIEAISNKSSTIQTVPKQVDVGKQVIGSMASNHAQGVAAVLTASFISGLAGALTQKSLQGSTGRNSYLFTMELCVASIFFLGSSMLANPKDREQLMTRSEGGFFKGWTPQTIIPILTNAAGGIIVGLVTKYAGAVKKGFALIFGLLLSGLLQARMADTYEEQDKPRITKEQIIGGILAAISLWMHSSFPSR